MVFYFPFCPFLKLFRYMSSRINIWNNCMKRIAKSETIDSIIISKFKNDLRIKEVSIGNAECVWLLWMVQWLQLFPFNEILNEALILMQCCCFWPNINETYWINFTTNGTGTAMASDCVFDRWCVCVLSISRFLINYFCVSADIFYLHNFK